MATTTHVYSLDSPAAARAAVQGLREIGFDEDAISLVARHDIEIERLPDDLVAEATDFEPAVKRGVALGGSVGLLGGLLMATFPPAGITLGGAALLGTTAAGAAVGGWTAALVGSAVPHDLRQTFETEIDRGRVLLAIDAEADAMAAADRVLAEQGRHARKLQG